MNETVIFIVGIVIFAITIYGTVMAGGIALTQVAAKEDAKEHGGGAGPDSDTPPRT